jgi:hypothetical protein
MSTRGGWSWLRCHQLVTGQRGKIPAKRAATHGTRVSLCNPPGGWHCGLQSAPSACRADPAAFRSHRFALARPEIYTRGDFYGAGFPYGNEALPARAAFW